MTSYVPVVKNNPNGAIFYISLAPRTANGQWQSNPTLAAGDVKISLDGGALANLNTLPAVTPASSKLVKVTLNQAETNADNIAIVFSDDAGEEWCDRTINLQTAAKQFDDLASQLTVDTIAGYVDTEVAAIKAKTDQLTFTVANQVDVNVVDWKGSAAPAMTGDAYARIGAPAGASVSADIAAVKSDSGAIKAKTDNLPSDPADQSLIIAATDSLSGQISGLNNLSQADIRNAVGLASANLDTQIAALATAAGLSDLSDGISASFTSLQSHGDGAWATASGFSTSADITGAVSTLEGYGDTHWATATGFSTYDGSDTAGTTTLLARLTDTRAGNLDNLDAAVTSRLAAADYTAPDDTAVLAAIAGLNDLSAAEVNAEVDTAIADAALATAASLAVTDGKVDAVKDKTDSLAFTGGAVDANIAQVNGVTVTGTGASGDEWGPA